MTKQNMIQQVIRYTARLHPETNVGIDAGVIRVTERAERFSPEFAAIEVKYSESRGLLFKVIPVAQSFLTRQQHAKVNEIIGELALNWGTIMLRGTLEPANV